MTTLLRYLLNEAASGTGPTTLTDDTGNGNTLTIDYSSGDAAWGSAASGNYLDFTAAAASTAAAVASMADITTTGLGASLDGASVLGISAVLDIDAGHGFGARMFHIGTNSGNGDIGVLANGSDQIVIRFDYEGTGGEVVFPVAPAGEFVLTVNIDTAGATLADRIKVYYDAVAQSSVGTAGGTITQNHTLASVNASSRYVALGNRPDGNRGIDGRVKYLELRDTTYSAGEISSLHSALSSDNDTDWDGGGGGASASVGLQNPQNQISAYIAANLKGGLQ